MKAIVTSIGEKTTELCVWALKRQGFEVVLMDDPTTTLWQKLEQIYNDMDEDFVRVDADTIVNRNLTPKYIDTFSRKVWWVQGMMYDWYKQDVGYGGVQVYRKEALPVLRKRIQDFKRFNRPETELSRVDEFYNPRRFDSMDKVVGLNNYLNDLGRVRRVKRSRGQDENYDWELAQRINDL